MQIVFEPNRLPDLQAVYRLDMIMPDAEGKYQLAYVGREKLTRLFKLAETNHNKLLRSVFPRAQHVCLSIMSIHSNEADAMTAYSAAIEQLRPPGNNADSAPTRQASAIRRSDGQIFTSIRDAAQAIGAPSSSISSHLAGRYGYRTVKGYRFERVL